MEPEVNSNGTLQIFRVSPGQSVLIRTLSDGYHGLMTHWVGTRTKGRSVYCKGKECEPAIHKLDQIYKAYAAVEIWSKQRGKWQPWVMELSEALELDVRGIWARGQVWEIYRLKIDDKNKTPIMGKLLEERDPKTMPKEFDIKAPLMHLYHTKVLHLGVLNPMPPRVIVQESDGDAPKILQQEKQQDLDPGFSFAEAHKELLKRRKTPTERKQGHS